MSNAIGIPSQPVIGSGDRRRDVRNLPSLFDLPHRVITRSGRSALLMALQMSGVSPGDRVLVPTYHCPSMIAPVERLGAEPAFYPITENGEPDIDWLSRTDCDRVRVMVVAHLFGLPRPLQHVTQFCRGRNITLVEDCAHCFFGLAAGQPIGTSGDFAIGSLPKFFPVLEGGVLASASRQVDVDSLPRRSLRSELRTTWDLLDLAARASRLGPLGMLLRGVAKARRIARRPASSDPGANDALPASIRARGLVDPLLEPAQIHGVERWIIAHSNTGVACQARRDNFDELARQLTGVPNARPLYPRCAPDSAPYVMPLLLENPDHAYQHMRRLGLPVFRWDYVWPDTPALAGDAATRWARGVVQIACHQSLRRCDIAAITAGTIRCLSN